MPDGKEIDPELRKKIDAYKCSSASYLMMDDDEIIEEIKRKEAKMFSPKAEAVMAPADAEASFTRELIKQLKSSGLTQRDIDLLMSKEGAALIARLITGSKDSFCAVNVDCSKNLYELLGSIQNARLDEAKINPQKFPKKGEPKDGRELIYAKVFAPGVALTAAQLTAILNAFGFRSATVYEALATAAEYPDKLRPSPVAVPGANIPELGATYFVALKIDGGYISVYAHNNNPGYSSLGSYGSGTWDASTKFLVVLK